MIRKNILFLLTDIIFDKCQQYWFKTLSSRYDKKLLLTWKWHSLSIYEYLQIKSNDAFSKYNILYLPVKNKLKTFNFKHKTYSVFTEVM